MNIPLVISIGTIVCLCVIIFMRHRAARRGSYSPRVLRAIDSLSGEKLKERPEDVPLYPGLRGVAVTNSHGRFTVSGCSGDTSEVVLAYYEENLVRLGWAKEQHEVREDCAALVYKKEERELLVGTVPGGGGFASLVQLAHTNADATPEARRAAAAPDEPEARQVFDRMKRVYAESSSYCDRGKVRTAYHDSDGKRREWEEEFHTAFIRPDRFRFEMEREHLSSPDGPRKVEIIHADASGTKTYFSCDGIAKTMNSLERATSAFTGITSGVSSRIPALLLGQEDCLATTWLFQLALLPEGRLGTAECYRVSGKDNNGEEEIVWIDKKTMMLLRVDETSTFPNFWSETTTLYEPELNASIDEEELLFNPPQAQ